MECVGCPVQGPDVIISDPVHGHEVLPEAVISQPADAAPSQPTPPEAADESPLPLDEEDASKGAPLPTDGALESSGDGSHNTTRGHGPSPEDSQSTDSTAERSVVPDQLLASAADLLATRPQTAPLVDFPKAEPAAELPPEAVASVVDSPAATAVASRLTPASLVTKKSSRRVKSSAAQTVPSISTAAPQKSSAAARVSEPTQTAQSAEPAASTEVSLPHFRITPVLPPSQQIASAAKAEATPPLQLNTGEGNTIRFVSEPTPTAVRVAEQPQDSTSLRFR
jgi:hypothetical protein